MATGQLARLMYLFDHNTASWRAYPNLITGAITYSEDIVKHQLKNWEKVLGPKDVLSTAPPLDTIDLPSDHNNIILYLHTWPVENPVTSIQRRNGRIDKNKLFLISAYRPYVTMLKEHGYKCVYIPMSVDVDEVRKHRECKNSDRLIYFGNVTNVKRTVYRRIQEVCNELGLELDVLSYNLLNRTKISEHPLNIVSRYKYGFGVGRAALEMLALDVKLIVAGRSVGGLITNDDDYELQESVNINGRLWTYSDDLRKCILDRDKSIIKVKAITNHANMVLSQYCIK